MGARSNGQRIFILVIVAVFFLTSVAFTAFVIIDESQKKDLASTQAELQQQLSEQQQNALSEEQPAEPQEGKLEGTKLANFTPVENVTELQIIDTKVGDGEVVQPGATVTAHYTGALAKDGTIFQSSLDMGQPIPFGLDQVIKGWTDGVPGMKVGGERRLIIPAEQAYGAAERPGIPANSDLVFDIVLVKIGE